MICVKSIIRKVMFLRTLWRIQSTCELQDSFPLDMHWGLSFVGNHSSRIKKIQTESEGCPTSLDMV
mgnify:CR=1 FL=1